MGTVALLPAAVGGMVGDDGYRAFWRRGGSSPGPTWRFFVGESELEGWLRAEVVFETPVWNLRRAPGGHFVVGTAFDPPRPFWVARTDASFAHARVAHLAGEPGIPRQAIVEPALRVLARLRLMYGLLDGDSGLLVHAGAVEVDGRFFLLAGCSGAGKSTLARQFRETGAGRVVNDDRVVVSRGAAGWAAWGTPWPGELGIAEDRHAPLGGLLFLRQAERTVLEPLSAGDALDHLLPLVSVPWYDAERVPRALDLCRRLVEEAPVHLLQNRPDGSAVEAVRELASRPPGRSR